MTVTILPRRGTAAQWTAANPILETGERGYETDTGRWKTGNGVATWNARPYDDANMVQAVVGADGSITLYQNGVAL